MTRETSLSVGYKNHRRRSMEIEGRVEICNIGKIVSRLQLGLHEASNRDYSHSEIKLWTFVLRLCVQS